MGRAPDSPTRHAKTVAILGGGLAGLSAARRLLEQGYRIILVEKRPFLGGRAFSFRDGADGVDVNNGQHVFLGCFTYYIDYLKAVGSFERAYLQRGLRLEVVLNGKRGALSSAPFLGRLHLLPSFVRYPHISAKEKALAVYGLLKAKLADRSRYGAALDAESAHDWLRRHHQSERAIRNLWNLVILPTLNDDARDVSANMALMVFQEALLRKPKDSAIGYARVGLTALNGEPAQRFIEKHNGTLLLGKGVKAVRLSGGRVSGVELSDGTVVQADSYVSALPHDVLGRVLEGDAETMTAVAGASELGSAPIVAVHLWYDRHVMDGDFVAFLESPVQFVFNKTLIQGAESDEGQYLCISLSGAWSYVDKPKDQLTEMFVEEMERLFPRARGARVVRSLVVKEPHATFRSSPGAARNRPTQATAIPNMFLAGDWTDTGWPATMEGAVRSGVFAADEVSKSILRE